MCVAVSNCYNELYYNSVVYYDDVYNDVLHNVVSDGVCHCSSKYSHNIADEGNNNSGSKKISCAELMTTLIYQNA